MFLAQHTFAKRFASKIEETSSSKFLYWIDHLVLPEDDIDHEALTEMGFQVDPNTKDPRMVYRHPRSIFFPVLVHHEETFELSLKPENIEAFKAANGLTNDIVGGRYAPFRRLNIKETQSFLLSAVERRGSTGFAVREGKNKRYGEALAAFQQRQRTFPTEKAGVEQTTKLVEHQLQALPETRVADAFFRMERQYWLQRNEDARIQKQRQDRMGLGYGNHDHHTFRCSRTNYASIIELFETMGLQSREAFYAGEKAGWGAQILEMPTYEIVVFADVDLGPKEKEKDFSHEGLDTQKQLGTVGLWVELHGESLLEAGMHHLAARYRFTQIKHDLAPYDVNFMAPFSEYPFLKQAFSQGTTWSPRKKQLNRLLARERISHTQYEKFQDGAIGSHLENIERNQGFKGFNQESVSAILERTDPREQERAA